MSASKRLVVCGGSGFLGSRICKYAVQRGWDVTSISRSGQPKWETVTSSASPPSWAHKVSWERADILRPATYGPLLKTADYVVHSMGILLEADYKGVVSGRESPITGLRKAFGPVDPDRGIKRPLDQKAGEEVLTPPNPADQFTYEIMNRDSAVMLAKQAAAEDTKAFAFISAAAGAPILPSRYITTKREAEQTIASEFPRMRGIFMRPPFMYDSSRKFTLPVAAMAGAGNLFNTVTRGVFGGFMGAAATKPLPVETVAQAVVEALEDENVKGPVEVPQIEELAKKSWRKNML
ncbi:NAD dependent epimerase/dehydratase family protein [Sodiomyces alkalinus F11]|uniref:NAD dependent epimerase/dehydratase family protein n=1 Tax=Sodiomyces alkalinus (strain CBS 110278 / VKM F-3762 / F11) TaxID=1314773 RepID=A0A3N2PUY9_SODAK|nr:NAD dependent epimerase/dehydratase family protein [Sodiomyces alkalinus F11]ROT38327.1 NAD dependent epimerase/dehydratase family protein [Sodiomyces alkalinus F11]